MARITFSLVVALMTFCSACAGQSGTRATESAPQSASGSAASSGTDPHIGKCPVFPSDNIWSTAVDRLPVDP